MTTLWPNVVMFLRVPLWGWLSALLIVMAGALVFYMVFVWLIEHLHVLLDTSDTPRQVHPRTRDDMTLRAEQRRESLDAATRMGERQPFKGSQRRSNARLH